MTEKKSAYRVLVLIANPSLINKATKVLSSMKIPIEYRLSAIGTASSEMMDILGLGSIERIVLFCMIPKEISLEIMRKLSYRLRLGTADSGIAFTIPLSAASNFLVHILENIDIEANKLLQRKDSNKMSDNTYSYSVIAAIVNRGYSNEVMDAARKAGATGGSILNSRRITDEAFSEKWGFDIQEEKEILLIVAKSEIKVDIMQTITEKCGMNSDAKGVAFALPVEDVAGIYG